MRDRGVKEIMSHFGIYKATVTAHSACADTHALKMSYDLPYTDSTVFSRSDPKGFSCVKQDRGVMSALPTCFTAADPLNVTMTPISFSKQSLRGCRVKAMKSNPAVIVYCRRRGG